MEDRRKAALAKLLPFQREDFVGIFTAMKGLPVTVRLLDPPLHEFLPHDERRKRARQADRRQARRVKHRVQQLHEANPMLGHRGCRLGVTYPEILEMQVTAIVEAAIACKKKKIDAQPEIMIPLVGTAKELKFLRKLTEKTIEAVKAEKKYTGKLDILDRHHDRDSARRLTADEIAEHADFFSFGTNDLTQMTFGFCRDDINTLLARLPEERTATVRSVPIAGYDRRWPVDRDGRDERPQKLETDLKVRHLRRAWRRSAIDRTSATSLDWTT